MIGHMDVFLRFFWELQVGFLGESFIGWNFNVQQAISLERFPHTVDMITRLALTPVLESVAALSAPAYGQEGGASSRLAHARERRHDESSSFETLC